MADAHITIAGYATAADLRFTAGGKAVATFSVANRRSWKVDNEWKEHVTWWKVTAWDDLAQNVAASLFEKGFHVMVSGVPENREWTTDDGEKRMSLELRPDFIGVTLNRQRAVVEKVVREKDGETVDRTPKSSRQPDPVYGDDEPFATIDNRMGDQTFRDMHLWV